MIKIIIINNNNDVCYKNVKDLSENTLYKKCGYKSNENFNKIYNYNNNNISYEFWGKSIDKTNIMCSFNDIKYFNKLLIIKKENDKFKNILEADYNYIVNNIKYNNDNINDNKDNIDDKNCNNNNCLDDNNSVDNSSDSDNNSDDNSSIYSDKNSELSEESYIFISDDNDDNDDNFNENDKKN